MGKACLRLLYQTHNFKKPLNKVKLIFIQHRSIFGESQLTVFKQKKKIANNRFYKVVHILIL